MENSIQFSLSRTHFSINFLLKKYIKIDLKYNFNITKMVKYSCERCLKEFSQKSHYDSHKRRKTPCQNNADKMKLDKAVEEKMKELSGQFVKKGGEIKKKKIKIKKPKVVTYIDLFCGLGAFHTTFNRKSDANLKYKCVDACDIDEDVRKIYEENYHIKPKGDITKINIEKMPDFDILCAGFPCQPFSIAGKKEGFEDKNKGNLFYNILDIIDHKKPPIVFLENVKNLYTVHKGGTFQIIKTELEKRGYHFSYKVIDSKYYNSPQSRKRVYIICTKTSPFVFPDVKNAIVPVSSIIDNTVTEFLDYKEKYKLEKCKGGKGMMKSKLINKKTGKGGRQGERVYSIDKCGPTVCASSGGPGAKTGLYEIDGKIRTLTVDETLQMFGFDKTYKYSTLKNGKKMLFYLGNSIVVNVLDELIKHLEL